MKETEYAYAAAFTRTLENKMLSKADFEALLNADSPERALRYLSDKGYGNGRTGQAVDAEAMLKAELAHIWNEVKDACPKGAPIDILLYQNDFHNLKTILKAVFSGTAYQSLMLEPYTVPPDVIHRAVSEGKPESLPGIFKPPAAEAYHILARDNDGQAAEIVLDKALFALMKETAERSGDDFLIGWVDLNIALIDTKTALRGGARSAMLGAGQTLPDAPGGSLTELELWCDNQLINYLRPARYKTFGLEPILGFWSGKQFELQAVRIILSGLRHGIPAAALRKRLRDSYV